MQIDITTCFPVDQYSAATRLIESRAKRLGVEPGVLLTTQLLEMVADEAGVRWPSAITEEVTAAAEDRADKAEKDRKKDKAEPVAGKAE